MGLQIALQAQERGGGFGDFTARQTMILRNRQGQESQRDVRMKVLEVDATATRPCSCSTSRVT